MKLSTLLLIALLSLTVPAVVAADTVYYSLPGGHGIQSVSGTIVEDSGSAVKIETDDGETISIPRDTVFQIVRNDPTSSAETHHPLMDRSRRSSSGRSYLVGFKGGMNISNISADPVELEDEDSLKSFAVGAWWGIPLNRRLTIQPEAFYSVKGDAESAAGYTASTHMGYIDVPVLAKIGFMHGSPARPSLFIGPSLGVNLSANSTLEGGGENIEMDVKEDVRAFDLGLVFGGGVDFAVGQRTFGVDLRYSKGLSNVAGEGANGTGRNDVIALLGSVGFQ